MNERLKETADHYDQVLAELRESNELMRQGQYRMFDLRDGGRVDVSDEVIARNDRQIALLEKIVADYRGRA